MEWDASIAKMVGDGERGVKNYDSSPHIHSPSCTGTFSHIKEQRDTHIDLDTTCVQRVYCAYKTEAHYEYIEAEISALISKGGGKRPDETRQPTCNVAGRVQIPAKHVRICM